MAKKYVGSVSAKEEGFILRGGGEGEGGYWLIIRKKVGIR